MAYAILVIWPDGEEEYLKTGAKPDGKTATFPSRKRADGMRDFMMEGMADEVQSINVVPFGGEASCASH